VLAVPDFAAGAMENTAAISTARRICLPTVPPVGRDAQEHCIGVGARDGTPVVRRSRNDAVVGRHLAQRRLRDLDGQSSNWPPGSPNGTSLLTNARNQKALNLDSLRATRPIHSAVRTPTEIDADSMGSRTRKAPRFSGWSKTTSVPTVPKGDQRVPAGRARVRQRHAEDFWKTIATTSAAGGHDSVNVINQPGVPVVNVSALTCDGNQGRSRNAWAGAILARSRRAAGNASNAMADTGVLQGTTAQFATSWAALPDQQTMVVAKSCRRGSSPRGWQVTTGLTTHPT